MIGAGGIGALPVAGLIARGIQVPEILDLVGTAAQKLIQPWSWLEFYTITTEQSGILRLVDFQDPDARGALPSQVPFNGAQYDAAKIDRRPIRSAAGAVTQFTITIEDPDGAVVAAQRAEDGLEEATVRIDTIPYDLIGNPALATTETYRVRQSTASTGPSKATLECGLPSLDSIDIPVITISRKRCFNDYNRRHSIDSLCRAPSDEFESGTFQVLGSDENNAAATTWPAADTKRKFGWWTQNANVADTWKTSFETVPSVLAQELWTLFEAAAPLDHNWRNGGRSGMYMYKLLDGDFDVNTELSFLDNVKAERNSGLLVQDDSEVRDWLFWGNAINSGSVEVLRRRDTTTDISTTTDDTDLSDGSKKFRLRRTGSNWKGFVTDTPGAWVEKFSITKTMGARVRVGLVLASDSTAALDKLSTHFRLFNFSSGGPDLCNRTIEDCRAVGRDNEHQFNGFHGIPNRAGS